MATTCEKCGAEYHPALFAGHPLPHTPERCRDALRAQLDEARRLEGERFALFKAAISDRDTALARAEKAERELSRYKEAVVDQLHYDMKSIITDTPEHRARMRAIAAESRAERAEADRDAARLCARTLLDRGPRNTGDSRYDAAVLGAIWYLQAALAPTPARDKSALRDEFMATATATATETPAGLLATRYAPARGDADLKPGPPMPPMSRLAPCDHDECGATQCSKARGDADGGERR